MAAFTPPALPGFFAIPAPIPVHPPFADLPFTVALHTRVSPEPRAVWPAWFIHIHHVLLDAVCDPGSGGLSLVLAHASLWLAAHEMASDCPTSFISGLTTGFSVLRFTSQPLLNSVVLGSL